MRERYVFRQSLRMRDQMITDEHVGAFRAFLGGTFIAAAAFGTLLPILAAAGVTLPVISGGAMVAARAGTIIEIVGSLAAGLATVLWVDRKGDR